MSEIDHENCAEILRSQREPGSVLFVLFVPSKDKDDDKLGDQELWADSAGDVLTGMFGGATQMPKARGKWYNEESKQIITEYPILVHSYASKAASNDVKNIQQLAEFCHRMGRETNQGEVALIIDGVFHRMQDFGSEKS